MDSINLIMGLFFIAMGFLVKSFPNLIAGYNTMPYEEKKQVDISGLSSFMRNSFVSVGIIIIVGYYLFKWIGFIVLANSLPPIIILLGVTIMVLYSPKFYHDINKGKRTKLTYVVLGIVWVGVVGAFTYELVPSQMKISKHTIQFTGSYGFDLNAADIETINLANEMPKVNKRNHGFSFLAIKKGVFDLEKWGESRLLLATDQAPFIVITKHSGEKIVVNYKDSTYTKEVYNQIAAELIQLNQ